ncbi:MAG: hypothetical protein ACE5K7_01670, partial [Phycisphaerae bacterium]
MRIIAAIEADLQQSPIGTRSRLSEELLGQPVLRRTIARLQRCRSVDGLFVLSGPGQRDRLARLCSDLPVSLETHDAGPPPHQQLVQLSRKWALDNWRGGIGGTCCFDEQIHPAVLEA